MTDTSTPHAMPAGSFKGKLAAAFINASGALPLSLAQYIGFILGHLLWYFPTETKNTILINMNLCWPHLSEPQRIKLAKQSFIESAMAFMEMPALWLQPFPRNRSQIKEVIGEDILDAALASDRGLILVIPHLGNWELCNHFMSTKSEVTAMYQPAKIPEVDKIIYNSRSKSRTSLAPTNVSGVRNLLKLLKNGGCTAILPDQEPEPSGGLFSPFFGQNALSTSLVSKLIKQTKSIPLMLVAERLGPGKGFRIRVEECHEGIESRDLQTSVDALNKSTEKLICHFPEQYQWSYKRFKRSPDGWTNFYP